ncbi:DUF952 domain-containing protein [Streptomyces lavendofoliae]|uniref:DUF952 domain-containing protein n=1 Tax=Streptomyces lavendofoliae TaxID=67314 RepID=A0A918I175_9ACTN|nr:DUF952 domain-containing protein [Streptomyces lavendofoliae]GGU56079.1 hypothetical protein GCM10010274_51460 [Streptomyces lavendofoliae]
MLLHIAPAAEWAGPGVPHRPASLASEGFVHCSPDEETALAVADAHYRDVPGPLLLLDLDEARLTAEVRWEGSGGRLFPHVYGPLDPAAVTGVREVRRDAAGRVTGLAPWA